MLTQTLSWRSSYKPENIRWEDVAVEFETGKMYKAEFADKLGRPVIIMTPGNQNSNSSEGQIKQLVYAMENALLYLPENQDQFVWIIDYDGWSLSKATPLKTSKEVANILQNHYPERLAVAILLNAPKAFEYVWKLIKPFVDPTTYKKARFVYTHDPKSLNALEDVFDLKSLDLNLRGKYDHAEYACSMRADDLRMKSFAGKANFVPENVMNGQ
ncbi:hypothetical protein KP509_39G030400 [Ceratopteris richardii]|nr:hypothetical protein KP509_39G030400 [Ceratopteris richardii]